jgi:hypothetical protein
MKIRMTVEIYRKETENRGTMMKPVDTALVLDEGDRVSFIVERLGGVEE